MWSVCFSVCSHMTLDFGLCLAQICFKPVLNIFKQNNDSIVWEHIVWQKIRIYINQFTWMILLNEWLFSCESIYQVNSSWCCHFFITRKQQNFRIFVSSLICNFIFYINEIHKNNNQIITNTLFAYFIIKNYKRNHC